jgi:Neuraminidase (sialidase)
MTVGRREVNTSPRIHHKSAVYKSTDNGKSWSLLSEIPTSDSDTYSSFGGGGLCRVRGGAIYHSGFEMGSESVDVWRSTDGGNTWSIRSDSIGSSVDANESSLVSLPGGDILMITRTTNNGLRQYVSTDGASTWQETGRIQETPDTPTRPKVYRIGGSLYCVFGDRQDDTYWIISAPVESVRNEKTDGSVWSILRPLSAPFEEGENETGYAEIVPADQGYFFIDYDKRDGDSKPNIYMQPITIT